MVKGKVTLALKISDLILLELEAKIFILFEFLSAFKREFSFKKS